MYFLAIIFTAFLCIQTNAYASCIEAVEAARDGSPIEASVEAAIYLQVIDHLIHANHAGHRRDRSRKVFIAKDTFHGEYYILPPKELLETESKIELAGPALPFTTQQVIAQGLSGKDFEFCWLGPKTRLCFKDDGSIIGGGIVVTLGKQRQNSDGSIALEAEIYAADLASALWTYTLTKEENKWRLHSAILLRVM